MMGKETTPSRHIAILGFHKIGEPPPGTWSTWNYIPEKVFVGTLQLLRDRGYQVLDLEAFLACLADPRSQSLPDRTALLTFDDGFASMASVVRPILDRFGYPAVLFVPTAFIGGTNRFDDGNEPEEKICDWSQLRELQRGGVSIQSHGVYHRSFSRLNAEEQEAELRKSKDLIETNLGSPVTVFSFPFGDNGPHPGDTDERLARAGYRAACLYKGGYIPLPPSNPYRLTRLPMGPDSDLSTMLPAVMGGTP